MLLLGLRGLHELFFREKSHHLVDVALVGLWLLNHLRWRLRSTGSLVVVANILNWLGHLLLNCRAHTNSWHLLHRRTVLLVVLTTLVLMNRVAILLLMRVVMLAIGHSCHAILILEPLRIVVHVVASLTTTLVVVHLAHQKTKRSNQT